MSRPLLVFLSRSQTAVDVALVWQGSFRQDVSNIMSNESYSNLSGPKSNRKVRVFLESQDGFRVLMCYGLRR